MSKKYRIVIAEDSTLVREALKTLISTTGEFDVVGEAADGHQAVLCLERLKPHLVLMDLSIPRMMGWDAIREIKKRSPETKVLTLTAYRDEEFILASFRAGADGYALKDSTCEELIEAMKNVLNGRNYIDSGISEKVIERYLEGERSPGPAAPWDSLTFREKQIVKLVGEGYTSKEIGDYLCISRVTVERHRANLKKKLNLHRLSELVTFAIQQDLVVGPKISEENGMRLQRSKKDR